MPKGSDIIVKQGRVMSLAEEKGMGSAYGGEWKPKKPEDERFLGKTGEVKEILIATRKGSYRIKTKIGTDGRAEMERHETDHTTPTVHTNPHDHSIDWLEGFPRLSKPINYPNGEYEFKFYKARKNMSKAIITPENMRFESTSDFKICLERGGEIEFEWNGNTFGAFKYMKETPDSPEQFLIGPSDLTKKQYPGKYTDYYADTIDEILDYVIDGERLRDIVTSLYVIWRSI